MVGIFKLFVAAHIMGGATGLVLLWVPILTRKGGASHRYWGRQFARCMIWTGTAALGMGTCTLIEPLATHPKLTDLQMIRGLFGWMMIYLAILTVGLAWHGLTTVRNKADHAANRHPLNVGLQLATIAAAVNCAVQGWLSGQPLMIGVACVGLASASVYLYFIYSEKPPRSEYVMQHMQALLGAGISVYTAFLAFGAVRLMPTQAFNTTMWAIPSVVGISIMAYYRAKQMMQQFRQKAASRSTHA